LKEVIILAGGFGTRLKSVVVDKPKCLAEVNHKPFISYLIESLLNYNYEKFIFSLGYLNEDVIDYINEYYPNLNVIFSVEEKPLLTGGAIRLAIENVSSDSVLILNADTYLGVNLELLHNYHYNLNSEITITLKPMSNFDRYGSVKFDNQKRIYSFEEKKYIEFGYINCGYIYLKKEILKNFQINMPFSLEKDFIVNKINEININAFIDDSYFIDIGIPEDYLKANEDFKKIF
jgi:D-glycero-alpha-D-manno-heptose 1-phosphate guanylyltransferase